MEIKIFFPLYSISVVSFKQLITEKQKLDKILACVCVAFFNNCKAVLDGLNIYSHTFVILLFQCAEVDSTVAP